MRVLVVEDDIDFREALVAELAAAGHEARACGNVPAARWALANFEPDIIFVDIGLPVFDGNELAAHVRKVCRARPVVVAVTGMPPGTVRRDLFDRVITKPVGWDRIAEVLDEVPRSR